MRQLLRLFIPLWLALCLLGCGKPKPSSYPPTMVEAARLSEHEAARALPLLEALADSLDRLDEEGRVYYDLLRLRVNDKLNVRATSDTLIRRVTAFYEAYGDPDKLMLAYYYRGRVCADLNDALQAVEYYRKAIAASKETKQYLLLSNIYSQMGEILEYQNMYEEAIPAYQKSYEYTLLSGDSVTLSMPIRDIAGAYYELGQMDSALVYYQKAYKTALETRNRKRELGILVEISAVYQDLGDYEKVFEILYPSFQDSAGRNMSPTYYSLGKNYLLIGRLDSAAYWLNRVCLDGDIYKRAEVYDLLGRIEKGRGNYESSAHYFDLYRQCQDSIVKVDQSEQIRRIKALYDYNLRERENQRLTLANERKQATIYRLLAVSLILLLFMCGGVGYYLNRRRRWRHQVERLNRDREKQYENSQAHLERNLEEIALLGQRLDEALAQKDHLNAELIRLRKESLEATNLRIELLRSERVMLCESLCRSSLYVKFHTSGARITAEDWASLRAELDRIYDLTSRLYEICPQISDMELRICYLIKIQVKVRDMASILNRSVSGVSSVRGRLYTKITGEGNSPDKLDQLILDL